MDYNDYAIGNLVDDDVVNASTASASMERMDTVSNTSGKKEALTIDKFFRKRCVHRTYSQITFITITIMSNLIYMLIFVLYNRMKNLI